jgi:hypothetical protein
VLVGFVLWHYPPGRATDPVNGTVLEPASDDPRLRIVWAVARTCGLLLALPVLYAALRKPSARQLWGFWAVLVACWLFAGDWHPNVD